MHTGDGVKVEVRQRARQMLESKMAAMNMCLVLFVILVMCTFGILMSSSIGVIALQPLERMLATVRERCAQIFKYTSDLEASSLCISDPLKEGHGKTPPFKSRGEVVVKLAAIANLTSAKDPPPSTRS
eukprot:6469373-Amphidinium_carterae.1